MGQVPGLNEAQDLVDTGLLVILHHLDNLVGSSHGKRPGIQVVLGSLVGALGLNGVYGELVAVGNLASGPRSVQVFRLLHEPGSLGSSDLAGLVTILATVDDAQSGNLVVDKRSDGIGVLDRFAVGSDPLLHLGVPAKVEAEDAQALLAGTAEAVGLAAGNPHGRVRLLHRLGDYRPLGDVEELS